MWASVLILLCKSATQALELTAHIDCKPNEQRFNCGRSNFLQNLTNAEQTASFHSLNDGTQASAAGELSKSAQSLELRSQGTMRSNATCATTMITDDYLCAYLKST
jgi:hypothetical protein